MSTSEHEPRRASSMRFLALGFMGTFMLAVLTMGIAAVETFRAQHATLEVADDSQLATYHLGQVGEQLARLRSHLALGVQESTREFSGRAQRIARIEGLLQRSLDALPGMLDPATQQRWATVRPETVRLQQSYADAATAIHTGQRARASAILARETAATARVHDALDALQQAHRQTVLSDLRAAHRDISRAGSLTLVLSALFLAGSVAIWSGITGIYRRQKRELAEYTARLESANSDLDAFAGRVAHDLKNALGPVVMGPAMIRRSSHDPTRVIALAERMDRCSQKAIALIDALLAFSRASRGVEAGESVALPAAMQGVLAEIAPEIARLDVTLEVGEIPDLHVRCSPGLLHFVLMNLCSNAVKVLEGRPERHIRIAVRREESSCRIEVRDTGPGIPREALQKIFDPFYRVDGSRMPGTGIGLATVRRIVEQRGGRIAAASTEGRGSCLTVWLRLTPPPAEPPSRAARQARVLAHR